MDYVKIFDDFIDQGMKTDIVVKAREDFDPTDSLGRSMRGLSATHIQVGVSSGFCEYLSKLMVFPIQHFPHALAFQKFKTKLDKDIADHGAALLDQSLASTQQHLMQFISSKNNGSGQTIEEDDGEDWIELEAVGGDATLTPEERRAKDQRRVLKMRKLIERKELFAEYLQCFAKNFSDEGVQAMIRAKDLNLFMLPENYNKIIWLSRDKIWEPKTPEFHAMNPDERYSPSTAREAIEDLIDCDQQMRENGVKEDDLVMPQIWVILNNLVLMVEVYQMIEEAEINSFLEYVNSLYTDVMTGRINNALEIKTRFVNKLRELVPKISTESNGKFGNIVLEVLYNNMSQFRTSFNYIRGFLKDNPIMTAVTKRSGLKLDDDNFIDQIISTKVNEVADLRAKKENGEALPQLTPEMLKQLIGDEESETKKKLLIN